MATIDFAEAVRRRLAERGQSQYRAAINSGLPQDAIRSVLNGHVPRLNRVDQICRALGLELYIGPPRDVQVEADDGAEPSRPLTRLNPKVQLPVRMLSQPSQDVFLMKSEEQDRTRPAPVDLDDPQAFYVSYYGYSMVPTGIGSADFCLVSPCAKLEPGQRIWLRDRKGREGLRWLIRLTAATYEVAAWDTPKPNGHQDLVPERWERKDVDDRGVILAVYRGWLVPSDPVYRLPDWHPGRLTGLWRALFDEQPEVQAAVVEHLEETTAAFNKRITGWLEQGVVQRSDMQDLLQQVESVKQLAQLLSRRSEASGNEPRALGGKLTDPPAGAGTSER
ncbi:MAG: helix-turn-helix transcriptional regulator [Acidobacteriota bacterium]|nr:helix-turn-helix transcriptional regulator [Acidobacteriota bacterium]